jgi:hypothetical protein
MSVSEASDQIYSRSTFHRVNKEKKSIDSEAASDGAETPPNA